MPLPLVLAALLLGLLPSCILAVEENNEVYADPMQTTLNIKRRDATTSHEMLELIQKMLTQHTEYLEKMMTTVQHNEELTKHIIENVEKLLEEPKKQGSKIYRYNRRSNTEDKDDIPIVKFGKDIVRYGNLLKTVIMSDITQDSEPEINGKNLNQLNNTNNTR